MKKIILKFSKKIHTNIVKFFLTLKNMYTEDIAYRKNLS